MTIEKTLSVQKREGSGKGPAGRARTQDMIPGVFYTAKGDNIAVQAPALPLEKMYAEMGRTAVFNLEIDDNGTKTVHPVMFWEVQKHPYKKAFTHVDFYGVDLDKEVKVDVPIEFVGVARGVKLGGVMDSGRTLAVHMYVISGEGLYIDQAYATAVILLVLSAVINVLSELFEKKLGKKKGES